ncbi:MAG TPA: single-stranded-DNA-specific exonuclease RecJ, partial [Polyangia bacterium]|nr:single-stranded-DNA-specific exonuclease RecJ [Polyangia bacterium]
MTIAWRAPSIDDRVAAALANEAKLRPLTARLLVGRGIVKAEMVSKFLEPRLGDLRRPEGMADLPRAI